MDKSPESHGFACWGFHRKECVKTQIFLISAISRGVGDFGNSGFIFSPIPSNAPLSKKELRNEEDGL
jgi:hypothetical protein